MCVCVRWLKCSLGEYQLFNLAGGCTSNTCNWYKYLKQHLSPWCNSRKCSFWCRSSHPSILSIFCNLLHARVYILHERSCINWESRLSMIPPIFWCQHLGVAKSQFPARYSLSHFGAKATMDYYYSQLVDLRCMDIDVEVQRGNIQERERGKRRRKKTIHVSGRSQPVTGRGEDVTRWRRKKKGRKKEGKTENEKPAEEKEKKAENTRQAGGCHERERARIQAACNSRKAQWLGKLKQCTKAFA